MCVHVGVYARVRSMGLSVHARARTAHAQRGVCARTIRACARSLVRSLARTTHNSQGSMVMAKGRIRLRVQEANSCRGTDSGRGALGGAALWRLAAACTSHSRPL